MASRPSSSKYLQAALELRENKGQWAAYESTGNCVMLAGPGSGKTKTLVLKLARVLAEDVKPPRGVACITYSNETARELLRRLRLLGLYQSERLFVGTIHSFCLLHLVIPYAGLAGLNVPHPVTVATESEAEKIFKDVAEKLYGIGQPIKKGEVDLHRRIHLDRNTDEWRAGELTELAEKYEAALRDQGLIDYEDMVHLGQQLVHEHDWVLKVVQAKFPVIAVDEYQDLGPALDRIVRRLTFDGGVRLIAVGDVDQSVYGFNGANSELLADLSRQRGVECTRLRLNYRSARGIIEIAERALGEKRGYKSANPRRQAVVESHHCKNGLKHQAQYAIDVLVPQALASRPGRHLGDIAILYRWAALGDAVATEVARAGHSYVRIDSAAPYKKVPVTSWIEDCATWCAGGWMTASPPLRDLQARWLAFHGRLDDRTKREKQLSLTSFLWSHRGDGPASEFVGELRTELLDDLLHDHPELADQSVNVTSMHQALQDDGALPGTTKSRLGRRDGSPHQLNLVTLHSAKGTEYDVVIMIGMDQGILPSDWSDNDEKKLAEARRLFYVGITRSRYSVYLLYSGFTENKYGRRFANGPSRFLKELWD